jgi:hypothetical protein
LILRGSLVVIFRGILMSRFLRFVAIFLLLSTPLLAESPKKPYEWPALPASDELQKAMSFKTLSGLVLLDKRCDLDIKSFLASPMGTRRDEFIRLLVANEDGVRQATIDVNDDVDSKIELVEGRTVAPDGTITELDQKRDVHKIEVSKLGDKDIFSSLAKVNFPSPVKGAVLDIHVVTFREGPQFFLMEPIAFDETPSLKTSFVVHINGGIPGYQWSVLVSGEDGARSHIEATGGNTLNVTVGLLPAQKREPVTVPYYRRQSTLLCYINFSSKKFAASPGSGSYQSSTGVDPRGRLANFFWPDNNFTKWWVDYLENEERACKEFIKHDGHADKVDVNAVAPRDLSMEERVKRLYSYVQEHVEYNPDAKDISTLGALVKRGENSNWQGTLYFSYLLERAGIPHHRCMLVNRYYLQFSPIVTNDNLYGMVDAVVADYPEGSTAFLRPGELSAPYGCLDDSYQNSLAIWLDNGKPKYAYVGLDPQGMDSMTYSYDGELSADGAMKGKLTLSQTGAPAISFRRWIRFQDFRKANPESKDKTTLQEKKEKIEKRLKEELEVPGSKLALDAFEAGALPKSSADPVEVKCSFRADGMGQALQDKLLVYASPVLAGFTNPFTDEQRKTPIWYDKCGHVVITGVVKLPSGAKIIDLPKPETINGPDGTRIDFSVEAVQAEGAAGIKTRIEYDQPTIVGYDRYKGWQFYESSLARLGESRCVISLPAQGELE